jgi:hypothetical protein
VGKERSAARSAARLFARLLCLKDRWSAVDGINAQCQRFTINIDGRLRA